MMDKVTADKILAEIQSLAQQARDGMHPEDLQLRTNVTIELRGPDGELKDLRNFHNTICTAGKNRLLSATSGVALDTYDYVCIGSGTNAAAIGDTALQTEFTRAQGTTTNPSANTWQVTYTFPSGASTAVACTESALDYQVAASSAILARQVFSVVNKTNTDTLAVTWQIT